MYRTFDMVLIAVMIAAAAFTYNTKHDAEGTLREIRSLERQIAYEEDAIDVLQAEWSLVTQPSELQPLAETYADQLDLQQLDPGQIARIEDIPMRPEPEAAPDDGLAEALAATGRDATTTGSVKP